MKNKKIILPIVIGLVIVAGAAAYFGGSQNLQGYLKLSSSSTTRSTTTDTSDTTGTTMTTTSSTSVSEEPVKLDDSTRAISYQNAVKSANLTSSVLAPSSGVSLTPVAPRHQGGAEIKKAEPLSQFLGSASGRPNGQYTITKGYISTVDLRYPTDQNGIYVLDCSVAPQNQAQVAAVRNGNVSYPGLENGHMLYAFQAPSSTTDISIAFNAPSSVSNYTTVGYFYGCELNKME
ncbi:MAG TPA: hypothetical protein PKA32_00340 [Candidatus Gracilibacteria bacterium]|nr:hypothetical protein [Candidatus Gracilibacteria bacterium]